MGPEIRLTRLESQRLAREIVENMDRLEGLALARYKSGRLKVHVIRKPKR